MPVRTSRRVQLLRLKEMAPETGALWEATKSKYDSMFAYVKAMQVKDKRCIFTALRTYEPVDVDTFFPAYGLSMGEFSVFQMLTEHSRRDKKEDVV